jgi:hypothetical protein
LKRISHAAATPMIGTGTARRLRSAMSTVFSIPAWWLAKRLRVLDLLRCPRRTRHHTPGRRRTQRPAGS